ncbi:hypothetical protein [Helicobacter sp. WB40]|uniref:hypothetical protein n=1 Tax=Helicobacter sp. WB40 TaxID=3004130 RepID=UPI0022EBBB4A|nr:hypothetical protein [Helicobacter sp. WB40]MDA3967363.1 hypothetical protein [Helicobacter sp. WB40]
MLDVLYYIADIFGLKTEQFVFILGFLLGFIANRYSLKILCSCSKWVYLRLFKKGLKELENIKKELEKMQSLQKEVERLKTIESIAKNLRIEIISLEAKIATLERNQKEDTQDLQEEERKKKRKRVERQNPKNTTRNIRNSKVSKKVLQ